MKKMKIRWDKTALIYFSEAIRYISKDSVQNSDKDTCNDYGTIFSPGDPRTKTSHGHGKKSRALMIRIRSLTGKKSECANDPAEHDCYPFQIRT